MNRWLGHPPFGWEATVEAALREDVGTGDLSVIGLPPTTGRWYIEAQGEGVVCGLGVAAHLLGEDFSSPFRDGDRVKPGDILLRGQSELSHILTRERTSLNFLGFMSGSSTLTAKFVQAVQGTKAHIIDTRKTLPGLRVFQKYAVRCGGGHNHRFGLYDAAMVKDNHIRAFGGITAAVDALRSQLPHTTKIEVECENTAQVEEAVRAGADIILLDNMGTQEIKSLSDRFGSKVLFEASGGVSLATVWGLAETGVDLISVGALTHSAPALPMHLEFE